MHLTPTANHIIQSNIQIEFLFYDIIYASSVSYDWLDSEHGYPRAPWRQPFADYGA
jgi:hypothetical protein